MDYQAYLEEKLPDMLAFAQELMRIRSVKGTPEPGAPFGSGCRQALDAALAKARELGFEIVFDADGYAGHAQSAGDGEPLAVLAHLDVVPEGSGWMFPPYGAVISDGKLYGRGALDDKGPLAAALYAAAAVKNTAGFERPVRLIFGCDEESGWEDIEHYKSVCRMPDEGFSPDADFPVVYAEKGIAHLAFRSKFYEYHPGLFRFVRLNGGDRVNVVPDTARAELEALGEADILVKAALAYSTRHDVNINVLVSGRDCVVSARGKASHGSLPENGVNAVTMLCDFLSGVDLGTGDCVAFLEKTAELFHGKFRGEAFGLSNLTDESGPLSMNLGRLSVDVEGADGAVDVRYPVTADLSVIRERFAAELRSVGATAELLHGQPPLYVKKDSALVQTLVAAYERNTGRRAEPLAIGGGTYARALKHGVAFGPVDFDTEVNEHMPNEFIRVEELYRCARIYADALYELTRKK